MTQQKISNDGHSCLLIIIEYFSTDFRLVMMSPSESISLVSNDSLYEIFPSRLSDKNSYDEFISIKFREFLSL